MRHRFVWRIGQPDDDRRHAQERRRVSAFERLRDGRDRSSPRGGGASGGGGGPSTFHGLLLMPPSGPHGLPYLRGGGQGGSGDGGRRMGYQRRGHAGGTTWEWRVKRVTEEEGKELMGSAGCPDPCATEVVCRFRESLSSEPMSADPMLEEAGHGDGVRSPTQLQCPVGPPAPGLGGVMPSCAPDLVLKSHTTAQSAQDQETVIRDTGDRSSVGLLERLVDSVIQTRTGSKTNTADLAAGDSSVGTMSTTLLVQEELLPEEAARFGCGIHAPEQLARDGVEEIVGLAGPIQEDVLGRRQAVGSWLRKEVADLMGLGELAQVVHDVPAPRREVALFDLNKGVEVELDSTFSDIVADPTDATNILRDANSRSNKESRGIVTAREPARSMAKYDVPLKKSLLCGPMSRCKMTQPKKTVVTVAADAQGADRRTRQQQVLSLEERATYVLLKAAKVADSIEKPTDEARNKLFGQFAEPLLGTIVGGMRHAFGLPDVGPGNLEALAADAED